MLMTLQQINDIVSGELTGADVSINKISIDTRSLQVGDLYLAIKGDKFDGNDFVEQAEKSGAAAVLLERSVETQLPKIIVPDTRLALAKIAGAVRSKLALPVCAITGSNGKTTVKEMVAAILSVNARVLSTQGNFNNDIGVPLTLLRLENQHDFAVIEMGANHPGEIAYTGQFVRPDISIITNVGAAHLEGFGTTEGIARAKSEIIQSLALYGTAVLNVDDPFFPFWLEVAGSNREIISFGFSATANVTASEITSRIEQNQFVTKFNLVTNKDKTPVSLFLAGQHNVLNALAAASACLSLGISLEQIQQGLGTMKPVTGRLEPLVSGKGNIIINDTYNANPSSLEVALEVLQNCPGESWVILGAFGELGPESQKIHADLGQLIKSRNVVRLLAVGSDAECTVGAFGKGASFFSTQNELIETLLGEMSGNETLLIKGSRAQKMEKVTEALLAREAA